MNKSKILAAVLLLAMFSGIFATASIVTPAQFGSAKISTSEQISVYPDAIGDLLGDKGVWFADLVNVFTSHSITADGDISDWVGLPWEVLNGVNISIAFDATNVYIAAQWADASYDHSVGQWNKTGLINPGLVNWQFVPGKDDVLQIGFNNGTYTDVMIWTASNRTQGDYLFECKADGTPDGGTLPYEMNSNKTTFTGAKPLYDNDWNLIVDEFSLANDTMYKAWHDVDTITPTDSQTDTTIDWDWNTTKKDHYTVEIIRALDTGNDDDIVLDFTDPYVFNVGKANQHSTATMTIATVEYSVALDNDNADLTLNHIKKTVSESLLVTGQVYDDYIPHTVMVRLGGGAWKAASINEITGNWSALFIYGPAEMPLGNKTVEALFDPMYEDPITLTTWVNIDDTTAPEIVGLVDVGAKYTNKLVPVDETHVIITVGLDDNYYPQDDITAYLYYWKDLDVTLQIPMTQFSSGSTTWNANLTIAHLDTTTANYTYFVEVWDPILNKRVSEKYWFLTAPLTTTGVPAFGILAGLFGLAAAAFILKKKK